MSPNQPLNKVNLINRKMLLYQSNSHNILEKGSHNSILHINSFHLTKQKMLLRPNSITKVYSHNFQRKEAIAMLPI